MSAYTYRPVREEECLDILAWRNADNVRQAMLTQDIISEQDHLSWWAKKQSDPAFRMMILEHQGTPIAVQIYFSIDHPQNAWWAFYFTPHMPEELGPMLKHWRYVEVAGIAYAFEILGIEKITCEVLKSNAGVLSWHKRFGFKTLPRNVSSSPDHHDLEVLGLAHDDTSMSQDIVKRWPDIAVENHPFDIAVS